MNEPFIGEIRMFGGNFPPEGWALCDGRLLLIRDYQPLFSLIGTTYGSDGLNTFALPDLRGCIPLHQGQGQGLSNRTIGQTGGEEAVVLTESQMPVHSHPVFCFKGDGNQSTPNNTVWAKNAALSPYSKSMADLRSMETGAFGAAGGSEAHENRMPYLAINFIIALTGVFPPRD